VLAATSCFIIEFCCDVFKIGLQQAHYIFVDAVTDGISFNAALYNTGLLHFFQVLGDGWLGQRQFVDKISSDAGVFV